MKIGRIMAVLLVLLFALTVGGSAEEALTWEMIEGWMPGWTLGYEEEGWAAFYRIESGYLTVCRVGLDSRRGIVERSETPAVPLSERLLERLEGEDISTLLDLSGYGSTFLTQDAWDQKLISIPGRIVYNDLQAHALIAMAERDGEKYIAVAEKGESGVWQVRESKPLPENVWMDLFHCGDDALYLGWMQGEKEFQCGFARRADGAWRMTWAWAGEGEYALPWYGVRVEWRGVFDSVYAYGTAPFADLFETDLNALPASGEAAAARFNTAGWATVNNPNPRDRLHLRSEPRKNGDSLGKFYNGTPLRVLEERGEWMRVRVGQGDALEGWMMRDYLAFGDRLRRVTQAFPELLLREEYGHAHPLRLDGKTEADFDLYGEAQIVGIRQETEQWIVMAEDGSLCLAPFDWFWEGNG